MIFLGSAEFLLLAPRHGLGILSANFISRLLIPGMPLAPQIAPEKCG
jgi:hypothetical protein